MARIERWGAKGLFVSSTFEDMHAERDFLREVVFVELEDLLRATRHRLEPVDLRWGIDTLSVRPVAGSAEPEEHEHRRQLAVLNYCLDSVDRCRPLMIVLLGDRYGWIPPLERVRQAAQSVGFRGELAVKSITALEVEYGVFASDAQMSRTHFFFRELDAAAMPPEDCRRYSDADRAALEHDPSKQADAQHSADLLVRFKDRIRAECPARVHVYQATWHPDQGVSGFQAQLRSLILEHIGKELLEATQDSLLRQPHDWVELEARALDEFIDFRVRIFEGREGAATQAIDLCLSPSGESVTARCVVGGPGIGKSSLFAHLHRELSSAHLRQLLQRGQLSDNQSGRLRRLEEQHALLLGHAAGMSPRSTSVRDLLGRWVRELALALGEVDPADETSPVDELQGLFEVLLFRTAARRRVILLLDGLNLFERTERARALQWLPRILPPNCRVLATANQGDESAEFQRRGWQLSTLGPLDDTSIELVFAAVSQQLYGRQGNRFETVRAAVVAKTDRSGQPAAGNPLWLRVALDLLHQVGEGVYARQQTEARRTMAPDERLNSMLVDVVGQMPGDVELLYGWLLERAEDTAAHFGQPADARLFACLITLSRQGLREEDLKALLSALTSQPWSDLRLAVLRRTFRTHLVRRGELAQWDFFHPQMRSAVRLHYLSDAAQESHLHHQIALYLSGKLPGAAPLPPEDPLAERELMYHWLSSGDEDGICGAWTALRPGTEAADSAVTDFVRYCCAKGTQGVDGSWFRHLAERLVRDVDTAALLELISDHLLPASRTFAKQQDSALLLQVLWEVTQGATCAGGFDRCVIHLANIRIALAHALDEVGDLANAAWHFKGVIQSGDEAARHGEVPEALLLIQCAARQSLAGVLATPVVLGLRTEAARWLGTACSLAETQLNKQSVPDFRWALLRTSCLIDYAALVATHERESVLEAARLSAEAIAREPVRLHALGVVALAHARHCRQRRALAEAEKHAQVSASTLRELHARFPFLIEPLQHLIEASSLLYQVLLLSEGKAQMRDALAAEITFLVEHLRRLTGGNDDLIPQSLRVVHPLLHIGYWSSVSAQAKSEIESEHYERAAFLVDLTWVALLNLARRGSWSPLGKDIEETLQEVATHDLAVATIGEKSKTNRLPGAMKRICQAVALATARNRRVDPHLHDIYKMLVATKPDVGSIGKVAEVNPLGNASPVFEPVVRFRGSGWRSSLSGGTNT